MILINAGLIALYVAVVIFCGFSVKKTGIKKNLFTIVFLILILLVNLYYYRPLGLQDIIGEEKFSRITAADVNIVVEAWNNPLQDGRKLLSDSEKLKVRRTLKDCKNKNFNTKYKHNEYLIKDKKSNIIRISIYGDYDYIEYGGKLYKYIKQDE